MVSDGLSAFRWALRLRTIDRSFGTILFKSDLIRQGRTPIGAMAKAFMPRRDFSLNHNLDFPF